MSNIEIILSLAACALGAALLRVGLLWGRAGYRRLAEENNRLRDDCGAQQAAMNQREQQWREERLALLARLDVHTQSGEDDKTVTDRSARRCAQIVQERKRRLNTHELNQ